MRFWLALILLVPSTAKADCDWHTIKPQFDGSYTYTEKCHVAVGQMKQDLSVEVEKVSKLDEAIKLKNLALEKADQRSDHWMGTALKLEEQVQKSERYKSDRAWIYFGLGVLTVVGSGYLYSHGR